VQWTVDRKLSASGRRVEMTDPNRVYRRLQQHLDRQPVGFPAVWSRADQRLLRKMFTPAEAEVALGLSSQPAPLAAIVGRTAAGLTAEATEQLLNSMFQKGVIGWKERDGVGHWQLLPMVIGFYESQDGNPTPEFIATADAYMKTLGYGASLLAVSPPQMRTIPLNQSIPVEHNIATYDEIREIVRESRGPIAVLPCICRSKKVLEHKPCKKTSRLETCVAFGDMAAMVRRRGHGREVTREEALAIFQQNEDDGLVLQPANARHPEFVCSCCGCCCGMLSMQKSLPHPVDFWTSSFHAEIDGAKCSRCGKCLSRCQVNAVTLPRGRGPVKINAGRCIGCGLCVAKCPSGALRLTRRIPETVPPATAEDLQAEIAARKKGPWARRRMLARVFLGMRQ
jgi:Na+-translocating ferredoxin:NAD+ oxidoreductase subunit B